MEDKIYTAVEVGARRVVTEIGEETIEEAFTVGFDEEIEGVKTPMRSMVKGSLIDFIQQFHLDTIWVPNVDKLAKSTRSMNAFLQRVVGSTSIIVPIAAFVKKKVSRMVEEVCFEKELGQKLRKGRMMRI